MSSPHRRVGIDIGGTFSDVFIFNDETGELTTAKTWSTKEDPSAIVRYFDEIDLDCRDMALFCHASTVGVNAVVTRTGVRTALLTTRGHRDVLDMGRGLRGVDQTWKFDDLRPHQSRPVIPREWRRPITERIIYDGSILIPLDADEVREEARWLLDQGVESIAVAFINSYLNPVHEREAAAIIRDAFPGVPVFTSTELFPVYRELYRTTSVAINAYISPLVDRYVDNIEERLAERSFDGLFTMMKVDGGFATAGAVRGRGIETIHSGPVAGVSAARHLGEQIGEPNLLLIDMGGTTADISIVSGGAPPVTQEYQVEQDLFLGIPVVDVQSIGAGGGSIAWIDSGGAIRVGPQSAGATPGPACYGRGGHLPTVTDAHVVRGTLSPKHFLGGSAALDIEAARAAVASVARPLGLDVETAAQGIIDIVEINMVGALRSVSIFKGKHPKDYVLVPFGAAGPMHGSVLGRELGAREVVVPKWPGEFSAFGLLVSDYRAEMAHSVVRALEAISPDEVNSIYEDLERRARAYLAAENVESDTIGFSRWMDAMYQGQSWDTRCELPAQAYGPGHMAEVARRFEDAYEAAWGTRLGMPIRVSSFGVVAVGARERPKVAPIARGTTTPPPEARLDPVPATLRWGGEIRGTTLPIFERTQLLAGNQIEGPALIAQDTSTTVLHPGDTALVDEYGNIRITYEEI